jgi:hypothetical protein
VGNEEPYTTLLVMRPTARKTSGMVSFWGSGGAVGAARLVDDGTRLLMKNLRAGGFDVQEFAGTDPVSTDERHVLAFRYDGAGVFTFNLDDHEKQVSGNLGRVFAMSGGEGGMELLIGLEDAFTGRFYAGDISEIVLAPRAIDDQEVANFRTYARIRWGGLDP